MIWFQRKQYMATLNELKARGGGTIGIVCENKDTHKATVLRVDDFRDRQGMIPGAIYLAPPRPDATKKWVYYRNHNTFRRNDDTAPNYQDKIIVESVPITFDGFVAIVSEEAV